MKVPEYIMDYCIEQAIYELKSESDDLHLKRIQRGIDRIESYRRNANMIELTEDMILKGQPFGGNLHNRPTSYELGQALVKANKYGLRLVKGGK